MPRRLAVRVGFLPSLGLQRGPVDGAWLGDGMLTELLASRSTADPLGLSDQAVANLSTPGAGLGQTALGTAPLGA